MPTTSHTTASFQPPILPLFRLQPVRNTPRSVPLWARTLRSSDSRQPRETHRSTEAHRESSRSEEALPQSLQALAQVRQALQTVDTSGLASSHSSQLCLPRRGTCLLYTSDAADERSS